MKIGIIARGLTSGGVSRFLSHLILEISADKNIELYVFHDETLQKHAPKAFKKIQKKILIPCSKWKIARLIWDIGLSPLQISKYDIDAIIYPKNIIPISHLFLPAKKYNVIHDLGYFEKTLGAYGFWDTLFHKIFLKLSCHIARHIFSVSEFTKQDIVRRLKVDSKKITVIHEGVDSTFKKTTDKWKRESVIQKYDLKLPFLFYCGNISPRKNLLRSLKAFVKIKEQIPHMLYFTGSKGWNNSDVYEYIKEKKLNGRVRILGHIPEQDISVLYSLADAFLYPSLYEGFGLPILEAQACECPVLTSNITSCPEIAGEGAKIIDPYSTDSIAKGILNILKNNEYKNNIVKKGKQNIKRFSWKKTSQKIKTMILDPQNTSSTL